MLGKLRKKNPEFDSPDNIDMRFAKAMEYKAKRERENKIEPQGTKPKEEDQSVNTVTSQENKRCISCFSNSNQYSIE